MRGALLALVAALVAALGVATGCGEAFEGGEPPPCNTDPWSCEGEQTCWVTAEADGFACMNPGPGAAGASCSLIAGSVGCDTGLFCFQDVCRPFCDPQDAAHACPDGLICTTVKIGETQESSIGEVQVCRQ